MSAPNYYNNITGHNATPLVEKLSAAPASGELTLTPVDPPYYFLRLSDKTNIDDSPYSDIKVNGWALLSLSDAELDATPDLEKELLFLIQFGLAMPVGETGDYAVNRDIANTIFYGEKGLFRQDIADTAAAEKGFLLFMTNTVLPGYILRERYITMGLSEEIQMRQESQRRRRDLEETLTMLKART
jgi:hypothetical protein